MTTSATLTSVKLRPARDAIRPYDARADREVLARAGEHLRMVTLAPEVEGAGALLAELSARGAIAALGHTRAPRASILARNFPRQ